MGRGGKSRVRGVGGFTLPARASPVPSFPSPYQGSCVEAGRAWPSFRREGLPRPTLVSGWAAVGSRRLGGIQCAAEPFPPGVRGGTRSRVCGRETQLPRHRHEDTARSGHEPSWRPRRPLWVTWEARGVCGAWKGPRSCGRGQRRRLRALAAGGGWGDPSDQSQGDSVPRVLSF